MITIKRNPIDEAVNEAKTSLIEYGEFFISHETKTKVSNSVLKVKAAYANSYVYLTIIAAEDTFCSTCPPRPDIWFARASVPADSMMNDAKAA